MKARTLVALLVAMFLATLGLGMVGPLLPILAQDLGATGVWVGLVWSGYALPAAILGPVAGRLSDRKGRKPFIVAGLAIYILVALGYSLAHTYYELAAYQVISGLGAAMVLPVAMARMGDLSLEGQEGSYMGLFNTATWAGWGAGPLIGGLIKDRGGQDATFYSMSLVTALSLAVVIFLLPGSRTAAESAKAETRAPFRTILGDNMMRGLATYQLVWALGSGSIIAFTTIFMKDVFGSSAAQIGLVISIRMLVAALVQMPFGRLADRFNRVSLITIGGFAAAVGTFSIPFTHSYTQLLLLFLAVALLENLAWPALSALAVDGGRGYGMGAVMGVFNTAFTAGMLVGSLVAGQVMDWFGVSFVFRYAGVAGLLGLTLFLAFVRRARIRPGVEPLDTALALAGRERPSQE